MIRFFGIFSGVAVAVLAGCASPGQAPVTDRGEVIVRTTPDTASSPGAVKRSIHVVRPGETLNAIARQYGLSTKNLAAWNGLADPNVLEVGQELKLGPGDGVVIRPIASGDPGDPRPAPAAVSTPAPAIGGGVPVKEDPRGGKLPYSEQAWTQATAPVAGDGRPGEKSDAPAVVVPAAATAGGDWLWPANGKVISGFVEGTGKGIDIAGKLGDPVLATSGGKVVYAGSGLRGYGKLVIIKHDDSFLSAYAHNRQLLVNEGQSVAKGQKIAEMGNSDTDRPKLHFEIRRQGKPVDPMKYLPNR